MANIKTAPAQWEKAREYFEAGLTYAVITEKIKIRKTQLSKRAIENNWQKGNEKGKLIFDSVRLAEAKGNLEPVALSVHNELVDERTKHIFFNKAALQNVREAMADQCSGQSDYRMRAETIVKGRETVLGKSPEMAIQINNNLKLEDLLSDI